MNSSNCYYFKIIDKVLLKSKKIANNLNRLRTKINIVFKLKLKLSTCIKQKEKTNSLITTRSGV